MDAATLYAIVTLANGEQKTSTMSFWALDDCKTYAAEHYGTLQATVRWECGTGKQMPSHDKGWVE